MAHESLGAQILRFAQDDMGDSTALLSNSIITSDSRQ